MHQGVLGWFYKQSIFKLHSLLVPCCGTALSVSSFSCSFKSIPGKLSFKKVVCMFCISSMYQQLLFPVTAIVYPYYPHMHVQERRVFSNFSANAFSNLLYASSTMSHFLMSDHVTYGVRSTYLHMYFL